MIENSVKIIVEMLFKSFLNKSNSESKKTEHLVCQF